MGNNSNPKNQALRIGLLLLALTWFLFTLYEFTKSTLYNIPPNMAGFWLLFHETASIVGLGFRTVAGFIAVITILFYLFRRNLSKPEAMMSLRWILLGEVIYAFSLLPAGLMTIPPFTTNLYLPFIIETGIPTMLQSILIPIALVKLVIELNPKKPAKGLIKWGLISGTAYIFILLWLNNTTNWIYTIMDKGIGYIIDYPLNLLSFLVTAVGLLVLGLYTAYLSKKSFGIEAISELKVRRIGIIITTSGLYFAGIYLLWIFFGSVGGWSAWYAWFLGHNMDLWLLSLPLVGVPLLFKEKR
jgi:hypothetical protein